MTALTTLQTQLQSILNQEGLSEDFKEAVFHGIYACQLGSAEGLNGWILSWVDAEDVAEEDKEYQEGVRFVEQQWEAITGMF